MKKVKTIIYFIDRLSQWSGKAVAWLMLFLIFELVYDATARYLFNAPTEWSFDISYMLFGVMFMIAGAYTLLDNEHIRIEVFYQHLSKKSRCIADAIGYLLFFFPAIGAIFYFGIFYAAESWETLERSATSYWSPPVYHFKTVIPLAGLLLLLQGISQFIKLLSVIIKDREII